MQYLLFLLLELCWPIWHLGNVGNGSQDHIYDGDTKEKDAKNIDVSQSYAAISPEGKRLCEYILRTAHLPHQLPMHFGHAVDGSRSLDTEVRGWVTWRRWTKRSNGAGDKESQAVLQSQVQYIMKA